MQLPVWLTAENLIAFGVAFVVVGNALVAATRSRWPKFAAVVERVVAFAAVAARPGREAQIAALLEHAKALDPEHPISSIARELERPPPSTPPILPLLVLVVGCAGAQDAAKLLEAQRDVLEVSAPCLKAERARELDACADDACRAAVAAKWRPVADAYAQAHDLWCKLDAKAEGCP